MKISTFIIALALILSLSVAHAGGRGGHNTTFDANSYGGPANVSCLGATVAGVCATGYNATCNGVADDTTAYRNFVTANVGLNAVLKLPNGGNCNITWSDTLTINALGAFNVTPIKSLDIWGYGASWNANHIGSHFTNTNSLIASTAPGDTSVTLLTPAEAANFAVGRWVCVCGLETQHGGYPPNFQFYEKRLITNISGAVISFNTPLANRLLSTWPLNDVKDGPATIWLLDTTWDSSVTMRGVTMIANGQFNAVIRKIMFYDDVFPPDVALAFGGNQEVWTFFTDIGDPEIDKDITFWSSYKDKVRILNFQSPSPDVMIVEGVNIVVSISGTPKNLTLNNITVPDIRLGQGVTLTVSGSTIQSAERLTQLISASELSFSAGALFIPKVPAQYDILAWGVPGQKYYFADGDGTPNCINTPQSACTFTVTAMRSDGYDFVPIASISHASPAVVTLTSHGLTAGTLIGFQIQGCGPCALPSPLLPNTPYYVLAAGLTTNTFEIAASPGGSPINTTTDGLGAISMSSGNFYADTDIGSVLPTPTCNFHSCPVYAAYAAATVKQLNSPAGSADLTQFAAPP